MVRNEIVPIIRSDAFVYPASVNDSVDTRWCLTDRVVSDEHNDGMSRGDVVMVQSG